MVELSAGGEGSVDIMSQSSAAVVEVNALEGGSTEKSSRSVVKDSIAEEDAIVETVVGSLEQDMGYLVVGRYLSTFLHYPKLDDLLAFDLRPMLNRVSGK